MFMIREQVFRLVDELLEMNSAVWSLGQLTENIVHDMEEHRLSAVRGFAVFVKRLEVLFD